VAAGSHHRRAEGRDLRVLQQSLERAGREPGAFAYPGPGTGRCQHEHDQARRRHGAAQAQAAPPTPGTQTETRADDDGAQDEKLDNERLAALLNELHKAIDERESLAKFKDQILLDVTPEGVRIQIVDHERRSMFPIGSARLEDFSSDILKELAHIVSGVPNRISISGHTDKRQYVAVNYTNWELSADRANAARRALLAGGLAPEKIGRVVGLASSVLLEPSAPESPVNRRISIVVMNKRTEAAISAENGNLLMVQETGSSPAPGGEPVAQQATP
jgi:chemotaxis protein MotB